LRRVGIQAYSQLNLGFTDSVNGSPRAMAAFVHSLVQYVNLFFAVVGSPRGELTNSLVHQFVNKKWQALQLNLGFTDSVNGSPRAMAAFVHSLVQYVNLFFAVVGSPRGELTNSLVHQFVNKKWQALQPCLVGGHYSGSCKHSSPQ
jgi:p-aminobenzoyl-glutamate transporter AbgT